MFSYVVFSPKIRLKLSYVYFVLNKVPMLHNNGSCILISKMSSKKYSYCSLTVVEIWNRLKKRNWVWTSKIFDGCAVIFYSHKLHKCRMIKTLNAENGMKYCCNEWNVPLNVSFSCPMHVLSSFWVLSFNDEKTITDFFKRKKSRWKTVT